MTIMEINILCFLGGRRPLPLETSLKAGDLNDNLALLYH